MLGPSCADPFGPRAVRASMGAVFGQPLLRAGIAAPRSRGRRWSFGGEPIESLSGPATICLGAEREGLPAEVLERSELQVTIPLLPGAESLDVAAAADRPAADIVAPDANMPEDGDG